MGRLRYTEGSISIEMDETLERFVERAVDQLYPGLIDQLDAAAKDVYRQARREWPVGPERRHLAIRRTDGPYHSADRLHHEIVVDGAIHTVTARVWTSAPWAIYIKSPLQLYRSAVVELMRKPMRKKRSEVADWIVDHAPDILAGG